MAVDSTQNTSVKTLNILDPKKCELEEQELSKLKNLFLQPLKKF